MAEQPQGQALGKLDLLKILKQVAPPDFSGRSDEVADFLAGVQKLLQLQVCGSEEDILMVVSTAFKGAVVTWYQSWQAATPARTWVRLRDDLCTRYLGHSFRFQAMRAFMDLRQRDGELVSFVTRFRAAIDQLRLAGLEAPQDFLRLSFLTKLTPEEAAKVSGEDLDLEHTLQAAERVGASQMGRRPAFGRPKVAAEPTQGLTTAKKSRTDEAVATSAESNARRPPPEQFTGTCFNCNKKGHKQADCPEKKED